MSYFPLVQEELKDKDIFLKINFVFSLIFILEQHEETA
jgi:hypothetical protein